MRRRDVIKLISSSAAAWPFATKVSLAINLKAAKTLGLNVPNTVIGRADDVIE